MNNNIELVNESLSPNKNKERGIDNHNNTQSYFPKSKWIRLALLGAFASGLILALVVISLLPIPDAQRYGTLKGAMTRVNEVHQRIVENPAPIDVAFVGTSHTWNGIPDKEIQLLLAKQGVNISVANLASSWTGRDMHLFILRQLLTHKKPRLVVIELNEHEYPYGHNVLPYVGNVSDMFCCRPYLDPQFPGHFALFLKQQVVNAALLLHTPKTEDNPNSMSNFGWMPLEKVLGTSETTNRPISLAQQLREKAYTMSAFYGLGVVKQMVKLAHANGADVVFLYLPEYQYANRDPVVPIEYYTKLAPVIKIPEHIGSDAALWDDPAHLNRKGALELAPTIAKDIREMILINSSRNTNGINLVNQ